MKCEWIPEANQSHATTLHPITVNWKEEHRLFLLSWLQASSEPLRVLCKQRHAQQRNVHQSLSRRSLYLTWPQRLVRPETGCRRIRSVNDTMTYESRCEGSSCEAAQRRHSLTPLQGPSNSSFRYLFSRDIFLPGVKDMLNQLGNLEEDKDQISPALLCLRREHLMSRTLTSAAWTRWSASAGAYEASQTEQSSSEPPGIRPRWSPSARTSDTDTADGTDAQSLAVIFTNSYHFLQIHIHLK